MASVTVREAAGRPRSFSRARSSRSSGVISTPTGVPEIDVVPLGPKKLARNHVPAGAEPECRVPAGIHRPRAGVTVHTRSPTTAVDAPRSVHSSSWKGWECAFHVVSRAITSS